MQKHIEHNWIYWQINKERFYIDPFVFYCYILFLTLFIDIVSGGVWCLVIGFYGQDINFEQSLFENIAKQMNNLRDHRLYGYIHFIQNSHKHLI